MDYEPEKLRDAVKAVREKKLSLQKAAVLFGVPVMTIKTNVSTYTTYLKILV
jgi:DNA-directed RNA polymerase specialized sigma24 family protein